MDKVPANLLSCEGLSSWLIVSCVFAVSSHGLSSVHVEREKATSDISSSSWASLQ